MSPASAALPLALVCLVAGAPAGAQTPSLERAAEMLAAGRTAEARELVRAWWAAVPGGAGAPRETATALYLRARLAVDAAAEEDYLAVALGYPTSPHAPDALLRLGQLLLAAGEPARSEGYLQRLVSDYPGRSDRPLALLWLARARRAGGRVREGCEAVRQGLALGPEAGLGALLDAEAALCGGATSATRLGAASERSGAAPPAGSGAYSVQLGAFRSPDGARELTRRLQRAGFDARAVSVEGSALVRVRSGRLATFREAAALRERLTAAGFEGVVVEDVAREKGSR